MTTPTHPPRRTLPPLPVKEASHPSMVPSSAPAPDETVLLHLQGRFRVHLKPLPLDHPVPRTMRPGQLDLLRRYVPSLSISTTDPVDLGKALHAILAPPALGSDPESYAERMLDQELLTLWLIGQGAVPTVEDLSQAAGNGNVRLVQRILAALPEHEMALARATTPSTQERKDDPVSALAVSNGWSTVPQILDLLIEAGVPMERTDATHGRTALHWAVGNNLPNVVHALLERGADPDWASHAGHTPVHVAAWANHVEVLDLLVQAGGDVLCEAVPNDQPEPPVPGWLFLRRLGTPRPDEPNHAPVQVAGSTLPAELRDTPLLQAADNGASKTLQRLIDLGVDPFPRHPPTGLASPDSPRDRRALDLARERATQTAPYIGTDADEQARRALQQLEQAWEAHTLRNTFEEHSPDLATQARPRL